MKRWAKPGVIAAAAFLAIAAGTAAYAMHATGASSKAAQQGTEAAATATAARPGSAACANEHPDCNDLQTAPPELTCEEADACATGVASSCAFSEVPCSDPPGVCTTNDGVCAPPALCVPDAVCQIAPVPPTMVCPDDVPVEICFPNARPAGPYVCEAPEPGTTVPTCRPPYCEPDPAGDVPSPTCAPVEPPPCPLIEKAGCGCTVPMVEGAPRMACPPPDCSTSNDGTTTCPPPPAPCRVFSDGTTACPAPMPPCAVSSSGVVTCPVPLPPDCEPTAGCSEPGAPPSGGGVTSSGTVTPG